MRPLCSIIILPRWDSYADHESPALDVIELLRGKGANVRYHDPYVPSIRHNGFEMACETDLNAALAVADCVMVVTDHSCYDWAAIRQQARMVDTRHASIDTWLKP